MIRIGLSDEIDLNASLNSGEADAGVLYVVPSAYQGIITVDLSGKVTPLVEGLAVVEVRALGGALLREVPIFVVSDAAFAVESGDGDQGILLNVEPVSDLIEGQGWNMTPWNTAGYGL